MIVDIQLRKVNRRLAEQGLNLSLTEEAKEILANHGYSPEYGARPLRRAIDELLLSPLSKMILTREFVSGDNLIAAVENGSIVIKKQVEKEKTD